MPFAILMAAIVLLLAGANAPAQKPAPNLVRNPGFEQMDAGQPADWSGWNDVWQPDDAVPANGARCARFRNADPARYLLLSQTIPARPGKRYRLSCRIKTENILGDDSGATVCLEWSDARGQYLGGSYPSGVKGTTDWKLLSEETTRIPRDAARVSISVYVRKGMTGTAWFDDVAVQEVTDPPFTGSIVTPGYRGVVSGANPAPVLVRGWMGEGDDGPAAKHRLVGEITGERSRRVLVHREIAGPEFGEALLSLPISGLPDGRYTVRVTVVAKGRGAPLSEQTATLVRSHRVSRARVQIGGDGVTLVDGKPFFPLGVYESSEPSKPESLDRLKAIAAGGFNCVMNYSINEGSVEQIRGYLDAANQQGLKAIYSIKDVYAGSTWSLNQVGPWKGDEAIVRGVVSTFRSHPALLAWYLNDELPLSWHDKLLRNYHMVRELDPDHPAWVVLYQVGSLDGYSSTADVMGVDPYPLPSNPLHMVSDWTDAALRTGLPAWVVPQLFDPQVYDKNAKSTPPTFAEMRCMAWLALAHGAKGLVFYSYFDVMRGPDPARRWAETTRLAREIRQLSPWLVSGGEPRARVRNGVHTRLWRRGRETLLAVVNPARVDAEIDVPLPARSRTATPVAGSGPASVKGNSLRLSLAPLEVRLYHIGQ